MVVTAEDKSGGAILVLKHMIAGAGAGAITKTSIAPLERIKILFQVQVSSIQMMKLLNHLCSG